MGHISGVPVLHVLSAKRMQKILHQGSGQNIQIRPPRWPLPLASPLASASRRLKSSSASFLGVAQIKPRAQGRGNEWSWNLSESGLRFAIILLKISGFQDLFAVGCWLLIVGCWCCWCCGCCWCCWCCCCCGLGLGYCCLPLGSLCSSSLPITAEAWKRTVWAFEAEATIYDIL